MAIGLWSARIQIAREFYSNGEWKVAEKEYMVKMFREKKNPCVCGETRIVVKWDENGTYFEVCANEKCQRVRSKVGWG